MAVDNRTTLNDCSATTGWTGDDTVSVVNATGEFYEGGSGLSWQAANAQEHMYTTSIGGTRNLSNAQVWMLIKDNLVQTRTNGGVDVVIGDGTNRIGYQVGGYDSVGLPISFFFNSYRLDVSNKPSFDVYAGAEASLNEAAITSVGYGTEHLAKANGAIDNVIMDRFSFIVNGNPAMTINAGTVGTPETFADVVTDDVTNGWGMIANPTGKLYNLLAATEWGDGTTLNSYFEDSNFQLFLLGSFIGAGNNDCSIVGNATGTNSLVWTSGSIIAIDNAANWDFSDTNFDIIDLTSVGFTDCGTFTFQAQDVGNKQLTTCTFNNCGQIDFDTMDVFGSAINGTTNANGAVLLNASANSDNQDDLVFTSDGTGHAIEITAAGTYTFNNWTFSGYNTASPGSNPTPSTGSTDAVVFNNSGGAVTINVTGGDTPTVRNAASSTTVVNNNVTVTITVQDGATTAIVGAVVGVYNSTTGAELVNDETDISGVVSFSTAAGQPVYVRVLKSTTGSTRYVPVETVAGTGTGLDLTVTLLEDEIVDA